MTDYNYQKYRELEMLKLRLGSMLEDVHNNLAKQETPDYPTYTLQNSIQKEIEAFLKDCIAKVKKEQETI